MGKITLNKHSNSTGINPSDFDLTFKKSEIILCNDINEPGIYIYTEGGGSSKAISVNDANVIKLKQNPTSENGAILSGDSLVTMVSKLQNQINSTNVNITNVSGKTNNIVIGVDLNTDGTYKVITGNYITTATSIADAIKLLDSAIKSEKADAIAQTTAYTDNKITTTIQGLDAEAVAPVKEVFVKITEVDGKISGTTAELVISADTSSTSALTYDFYLGTQKFGTINVPKDQFLRDVAFIYSATSTDVATAATRGKTIELGKSYLVFHWNLSTGEDWTYVDITSMIAGLTAKDIKISSAYTKTSYNIKYGTTVEDAIDNVVGELDKLHAKASANTLTSDEYTINITTAASGTNLTVNIDDDTIKASGSTAPASRGKLYANIDIKKESFETGDIKAKYSLMHGLSQYGTNTINVARDYVQGFDWLGASVSSARTASNDVCFTTTISAITQTDLSLVTGATQAAGNGLTTAWAVKTYINNIDAILDTTANTEYITGITQENGKITAIRTTSVSGKDTEITTATTAPSNTASAAITGVTLSGAKNHALTFDMSNKIFSAAVSDNADTLDSYHAGNTSGCIPIANGTLNENLNSEMVGGYKIVVGSTGTTAGTIYFL